MDFPTEYIVYRYFLTPRSHFVATWCNFSKFQLITCSCRWYMKFNLQSGMQALHPMYARGICGFQHIGSLVAFVRAHVRQKYWKFVGNRAMYEYYYRCNIHYVISTMYDTFVYLTSSARWFVGHLIYHKYWHVTCRIGRNLGIVS